MYKIAHVFLLRAALTIVVIMVIIVSNSVYIIEKDGNRWQQ